MAILAVCSVACGDDDESTPVADFVVAKYNGAIEMTVSGNSQGSSEFYIEITKTSDATVSMSIVNKETTNHGMSVGHIDIDGVTVTDAGNSTYKLSKSTSNGGFTATDVNSASKTVWTFTTFEGTVSNGTLNLDMVAKPGAMPMPVTMKFTGSK